ncbi:MAG: DNA translocase FtsK [bacterium]|nr:DNA translocase FtsK [bacterium]
MSGRKPKKRKGKHFPWYEAGWLRGLLLLALSAFLGLSLIGGVGPWWEFIVGADHPAWAELIDSNHLGGPVGSIFSALLYTVFGGVWCWAFPVFLGVSSITLLFGRPWILRSWIFRAVPLWIVTTSWLAQPLLWGDSFEPRISGAVGYYVAMGFISLFNSSGAMIFLTLLLLITVGLVFKPWLGWLGPVATSIGASFWTVLCWPIHTVQDAFSDLGDWIDERKEAAQLRKAEQKEKKEEAKQAKHAQQNLADEPAGTNSANDENRREPRRHHSAPVIEPPVGQPVQNSADDTEELILPGASGEYMGEGEAPLASGESETAPNSKKKKKVRKARGPIVLPGVDLLTPGAPDNASISNDEMDAAADLLEKTLHSFGVDGEVKDVRPGPVVTTFEFQPGHGIRVNQIVQRADDLALAMRARTIRMEAPIPGKAAVGIEIPNNVAKMVRLREVIELVGDDKRKPLQVVLGKDVVGRPVSIDIAALPHLLVAGSTGSGKSVCLNAIISHLLLTNDPSTLRMVMIDPKMLEMNVYNGIPHLLLPVVTDPKESLKALQWMVAQMEYRYRKLAKCSVRNIQQYNDKVARGEVKDDDGEKVTEPMPFFLTIVDELADLMLQLGKDLEDLITRLAQKARAVGIHLILATQRPSVDVLTGVIKANIPCRIAFRVIQMNDSRTILDMKGAEQLLGHGDMLYLQPGRALPVRVHGSFIDVDECEAITRHWMQYSGTTDEIQLNEKPEGGKLHTGEDDLFEEAMRIVVQHQSGSTSLLQRRLRVGYTRAGRLMDMLEESGIVGPFTGSKARDVLIGPEDLPEANEGMG